MLRVPWLPSPGAIAATSWYAERTLLADQRVEGGGAELRPWVQEPGKPSVVDEDVDVTRLPWRVGSHGRPQRRRRPRSGHARPRPR